MAVAAPTAARSRIKTQPLHWTFAPVPIVTTGAYHVLGPTVATPDQEPSTIRNFKGTVGYALLAGMLTRTHIKTGAQVALQFGNNTNMRFMTGMFQGTDGKNYSGSFVFIWLDGFLPGPGGTLGTQLHDLNPTQFPPVGLFWTIPLPDNSLIIDLNAGTASMHAEELPIFDYGNTPNALFGGGAEPIPGAVSFQVVWKDPTQTNTITSNDPDKGIFSGTFIRTSAQIEWSAAVGDYIFESAPLETSTSTIALIGEETNGVFLGT